MRGAVTDTDPDASLVERARAGDRDAFEQLVRRHVASVHGRARAMLGSDADAADVTQEAFIRAHDKLDGFRGDAKFSSWLKGITTNLCLMRLRSKRRTPETSIEELLPTFQPDGHHTQRPVHAFAETCGLDDLLARQQLARRAIARLPDEYREILLLRRVQELSTEEAARVLAVSTTAAKLRLHRAHLALRALLAQDLEVAS